MGGKAEPLFHALVPCQLAGIPGVIRVTVVRASVPHLLSVGLFESIGAVIDVRRNTVNYQELGVSESMQRLRSRQEYGLEEGAFNLNQTLEGSAVEVYMCASDAVVGSLVDTHRGSDHQLVASQGHSVHDRGSATPCDAHVHVLRGRGSASLLGEHAHGRAEAIVAQAGHLPCDPLVDSTHKNHAGASMEVADPAPAGQEGGVDRPPMVGAKCLRHQYGSWTRCLMCQTKLTYVPRRTRPPTKKEKGKTTAYTSALPPKSFPRAAPSSDPASSSKDITVQTVTAVTKLLHPPR